MKDFVRKTGHVFYLNKNKLTEAEPQLCVCEHEALIKQLLLIKQ